MVQYANERHYFSTFSVLVLSPPNSHVAELISSPLKSIASGGKKKNLLSNDSGNNSEMSKFKGWSYTKTLIMVSTPLCGINSVRVATTKNGNFILLLSVEHFFSNYRKSQRNRKTEC